MKDVSVSMSQQENESTVNGVAIIGMAARFPGARNVTEFWENLVAGKETISFFEPDELEPAPTEAEGIRNDPHYVRARGVLEGAETFDAAFFGINPREAELMDPQHRVFLENAWEAFEDAGYDPLAYTGPVGVFAGMANNSYFPAVIAPRRSGDSQAANLQTMFGNEKDYLATRISYKLNLRGPGLNIQTACSTSLVAVAQAHQALQGYQCDMAIAGGVSVTSPQKRGYLYHEGAIVSPDGHCRAFDAQAGGTVFSNGTGIVLLKRLADAVADHDHIYAVIRGVGLNNDGSARVSFAAPSVDGQAEAIAMAQALAGVDAGSITYVETHGTGTALGDPVELAGLTQAFRLSTERNQFCAIGSVKSNIGHLDAAAGIAGLIKTSLALKNAKIPASLHYTQPNPKINFAETPFYVNARLADWPAGETPRRAGVSSFGSGGTNAHVVVEEAPERQPSGPARSEQLFIVSARSKNALDHAAGNLSAYLTASDSVVELADVAFTLQTGRRHFQHRRATVAHTAADAAQAFLSGDPKRVWSRECAHADASVVFLFPGQGAQQVNMGRGLYENEPVFAAQVDECTEVLLPLLGLDLRTLLYPQPGQEEDASRQLKETFITQPALFVVEYALAQLWMQWGVAPKAMIGHSLGEYVAACVAGVFSRNDALRIISARARLMQDLPAGAMLAVRLPESEVSPLLGEQLSIAALNSPGMTVVSGPFDAIDALAAILEEKKVMCRRLATSHAFHSAMLDPMLPAFAEVVGRVHMNPPQVPFVSSLTGAWITDEQATSPDYWVQQVRRAVRFSNGIAELLHAPANILVEVGPGQTLSTLARQHPAKQPAQEIVASLKSEENATQDLGAQDIRSMLEAAGRIWTAGGNVDWVRLHGNEIRNRVPLPTYPFERQRYWIDSPLAEVSKSARPDLPQSAAAEDGIKTFSKAQEQPMTVPQATENPGDILQAQQKAALVKLRTLFSDISGLAADQLMASAPFLEIGLDSLLLTQASTAIEKAFGARVTFRQLLEELSSVDALAAHLAPGMPVPASSPVAVAPLPLNISAPAAGTPSSTEAGSPPASLPGSIAPSLEFGGVEALVRKQLEIMEKQLELLRNGTVQHDLPRSAVALNVISAAAPATVVPAAAAPEKTAVVATNSSVKKPEVQAFGPYKPVQKGVAGTLLEQQQKALDSLIDRYTTRTRESKRLTAAHRAHLADPRTVSGFRQTWKEMIYPIVTERSQGSRLWDVDGNEYVDMTNGFGSILFGHRPDFVIRALSEQMGKGFEIGPQSPLAGKVADLICRMTGMERAAFCNTGSEAVVAAVRTARTVTGRDKIAMFTGDYHGIFDEVLARPQTVNGELRSRPVAPGVPQSAVDNVLVVDYGDPASLDIVRAHAHELAAVLVEPVQSRRPDLLPKEFLQELRALTLASGTVLVFDEIVTGFRVHPRGAQGYFGIQADVATYGKVIGGGMPIGIIAGKAKYLDALDGGQWNYSDASGPEAGMTFFAGTFVRHPLALAACWACLNHLHDNGPDLQRNLNKTTRQLVETMLAFAQRAGAPIQIPYFASWMCFQFPPDVPYASLFWAYMRAKGIHMWEGRPSFLTTAHTDEDLELVLKAFKETIVEMQHGGFLPGEPPQEDAAALSPACAVASEIAVGSDSLGNVAVGPHTFPMTEAQREVWASAQMGADASCAYNVCHAFRLRGAFSMEAMKTALQQLVDRHQAMRLVCDPDGETQHELASVSIPVVTVDLSAMSAAERQRETSLYIDRETDLPFDLEKGPLCRAVIMREDSETHLIIFTAHHIVCDGWSGGILVHDLGALYEAESVGMHSSLPPAHSFEAYVAGKNDPAQVQQSAEAAHYWTTRFAKPPEPVEMPLDFLRKPVKSYAAERQRRQIPEELYRKVSRVAAQNGCTTYTMMFAAMQVLIYRLTGQDDFVLGTVVAAQATAKDSATLVGHATNVLPVRVNVNPEATFEEHLKAARRHLLDAFDHQSISFGSLVQSLNLPRDPSRNSLVGLTFNTDDVTAPFRFHSVEAELLPSPKKYATFDLEFNILKTATSVFAECIHSTAILQPATVQRWLENFENLLASICQNPAQKVADLALMTPEQERELRSPPQDRWQIDECIHHFFEEQVARTPHAIAVTSDDRYLTYSELNSRSNAIAKRLTDMGAGPDVVIALCVERSVDMLAALLGILKSGAAYLPIDLRYPADRVAFMLKDSGVPLLITERSLESSLPKHQAQLLFLDDVTESRIENIGRRSALDHLAYVIYTSGSTGKPKGVEVLHRGVTNVIHSFQQLLQPGSDDVLVATTTLSFDIHVLELFMPIQAGARLVIATDEEAQDPVRLISLLKTSGATIYQATPVRYRMLLDAGWEGKPTMQLLCGGEKLTRELADQLLTRCATLWNVYGPTETTVWSSAARIEADDQPINIGKPIANTTLFVLDSRMRPTAPGAPGDLFIGGEGVARGYLKRPELTQERFVPNPFGDGRLYKTGDRARYRADGSVELMGRNDDQVKVRGFRIELGEIEIALQSLPDVLRAAVVVHNDGDDQYIVAHLVPVPGVPLTPAELRGALLETLPEYMIPSAFVLTDALPTTPNGKLDRKALPPPDFAVVRRKRDSVPPLTSTEITLAAIWESLLKVEKVGVHESFFDLGGHSIMAVRLMAQVRSSFGIQLPLHHIFRTPTISGLATLVELKLWAQSEPQLSETAKAPGRQVEIEI